MGLPVGGGGGVGAPVRVRALYFKEMKEEDEMEEGLVPERPVYKSRFATTDQG